MAETSERVMDMVRREVEKNPDVSSQELFEKAKKIDDGVGKLSVRQFHARYPLQVKRSRARSRGRGARRGRKTATRKTATRKTAPRGRTRRSRPSSARSAPSKRGRPKRAPSKRSATAGRGARAAKTTRPAAGGARGREAVRSILIQFAGEVAAAEGKADVVQVIGGMDAYVDRLINAASS